MSKIEHLATINGPSETRWLDDLVRSHLCCLKHTASSRAGPKFVRKLYSAILAGSHNYVGFWPGQTPSSSGSFICGTTNIDIFSNNFIRHLGFLGVCELGIVNLRDPRPFIAKQLWGRKISGSAYIMTIANDGGVATSSDDLAVLSKADGRFLLRTFEKHARKTGAKCVQVDTELTNQRAIGFYLRNGYEVTSNLMGQVLLSKSLLTLEE
jgi:hypothetical protein